MRHLALWCGLTLSACGAGDGAPTGPVTLDLRSQRPAAHQNQLRMAATRGTQPTSTTARSVAEMIAPLELAPGDVVADIGCGSGFTIPTLREQVGPTGMVYAVEYFPPALAYMERRFDTLGYDNVRVHQDSEDALGLPSDALDHGFMINVLHAFVDEDRAEGISPEGERFLASIHDALRPGGQLLVVDVGPVEDQEGPPPAGHFLSREVTRSALQSAGFELRPVADLSDQGGIRPYRVVAARPGV